MLSLSRQLRYANTMFHLVQSISFEQIIKKSRFTATAIPIASEQDVKAALITASHADAGHNCWAWRIGQSYRFSDDGEPSGTAGKPILAAIDGQEVNNVLVVVSRWFGGVLLGTGGLVRAYGGTASSGLKAGTFVTFMPTIEGKLQVGFSDLALVKARLATHAGVTLVEENFTGDGAEIVARFPEAEIERISQMVSDLTSGRTQISVK